MFDSNTGWAIHEMYGPSAVETKILRTTAGILIWKDVSAPLPKGGTDLPVVSFVDQNTAVGVSLVSNLATSTEVDLTG